MENIGRVAIRGKPAKVMYDVDSGEAIDERGDIVLVAGDVCEARRMLERINRRTQQAEREIAHS